MGKAQCLQCLPEQGGPEGGREQPRREQEPSATLPAPGSALGGGEAGTGGKWGEVMAWPFKGCFPPKSRGGVVIIV